MTQMNNRIKELAEQAGFILWADEPWSRGQVVDWGSNYDIQLEKFAELIVQECLSICKEREQANLYGVREVENTIKQHFGVE